MKKTVGVLILFLILCSFETSKIHAQESDSDHITNFQSDVVLNKDASISIKESINYHFASYKHGIIREIPTNYKTSGGLTRPTLLKLKNLYYFNNTSPVVTYDAYERSINNGYRVFKIGDADTTIIGDYTYVIDYNLDYAINYFDDHDELYLNITGNGWEVPISRATATLMLPGTVTSKLCYTGELGSTASNCEFVDNGNNTFTVTVKNLNVYEGLTVVFAMPKGTIANTTTQQAMQAVLANLGFLLPILVLSILMIFYKKINKNKKLTIIPNYGVPKSWNSLRSGFMYKQDLSNNVISAQIIELAINGYIHIKQLSRKEYELSKTAKGDPADNEEKMLYDGLFQKGDVVKLKDLSSKFYSVVMSTKASTEKRLYTEDFLSISQRTIFNKIFTIGILMGIFTIVPIQFFINNAAMGWFWGLLLSSILIIIFALRIDKRSTEGNKLFYELEGLKLYINTAEKHRIEFHNDPKKYIGIFEKLLPYAMIFGLEKKWAKEFEDIYTVAPDWYEGDTNLFNAYILSSSLSHMHQQVATKVTATNSSYGFASSHGGSGHSGFSGGHSGGGFGGGGGGSW